MSTKEQLKEIKKILRIMQQYIQILQELVDKDDMLEQTTTKQYEEK